jgi:hypothetical protein
MSLLAGLYLLLTGQVEPPSRLPVILLLSLETVRFLLYYLAALLVLAVVLPIFTLALLYNCLANRLANRSPAPKTLALVVRRGD